MNTIKAFFLNFVPYEWWPMSELFSLQSDLLGKIHENDKMLKRIVSEKRVERDELKVFSVAIEEKEKLNISLKRIEDEINNRLVYSN